MVEQVAPGLTADWLNAWLAAIGATVILPQLRLGWTDDPTPRARLSAPGNDDLAELIAKRLPTVDELEQLVIAGLPQNVPPTTFQDAAEAVRSKPDHDPSLGILTTDAGAPAEKGQLPNGPFNVGMPAGRTLFKRLRDCRSRLDVSEQPLARLVQATLDGVGERHDLNGLGFDYRRIAASVPGEAAKLVDPVVECLCFHGLFLHPLGGDGKRARQRGWTQPPTRPYALQWPTWRPALDHWAIDALLDTVYGDTMSSGRPSSGRTRRLKPKWRLTGVTALYGSVPFKQAGSNDVTRGYGSERLA